MGECAPENYKQARLLLSTGTATVTVGAMGASSTSCDTVRRTGVARDDGGLTTRHCGPEDADVS